MASANHRVVVVTGATAGVGRAVALTFARRGWNVALIARDHAGLESTRREVENAGTKALTIAADVADADAVFAAADRVAREWQAIDVWVNNAMATIYAPVWDVTPAEFRRAMEVTYFGYVFGTQAALRHMRPRSSGVIVQVGSALSYRANSAAGGILCREVRRPRLHGCPAQRTPTRAERHSRDRGATAGGQHPAIRVGPQQAWIFHPTGAADLSAGGGCRRNILGESETPREAWVGFSAMKAIVANMLVPGLLDTILATRGYRDQITSKPRPADAPDNLFAPVSSPHATRGHFDGQARAHVSFFSAGTVRLALALAAMAIVLCGALAGAVLFQLTVG